ncbi:MAG: glutathione S-transferase family protein [Xanthomonadales bacterium]
MYVLHGFFTQNTLKTLYVLEEVGVEYEFRFVDLTRGENRGEAFRAMTPAGKAPVLEHDGAFLFESGAICRYVAGVAASPLYPADKLERARVDQWMSYFSNHPGRWLTELYWEKIMKPAAGVGPTDEARCATAQKLAASQLKAVERALEGHDWLANDAFSIVEPYALAYLEQSGPVGFDLEPFPRVRQWYARIDARDAVRRVRERVAPHRAAVMGG